MSRAKLDNLRISVFTTIPNFEIEPIATPSQVENYFYSVRKNVFEYDDVGALRAFDGAGSSRWKKTTWTSLEAVALRWGFPSMGVPP